MDGTVAVEVHHYGDWFVGGELADRTTLHGTGMIDIVTDPKTGEVQEVWFRCLSLPFRVTERGYRSPEVINPPLTITAIEYVRDS